MMKFILGSAIVVVLLTLGAGVYLYGGGHTGKSIKIIENEFGGLCATYANESWYACARYGLCCFGRRCH